MSTAVVIALLAIGLLVGVLVGAVAIGGVLLVPALTYIGGVPVHVAIASTMVAYVFSGSVASTLFARRGSIRWIDAAWLGAAAMPGAFLGAAAMSAMPGHLLELLIAALIVASTLHALLGGPSPIDEPRTLANAPLVAIGFITGVASSMSGTGGPLVLVPILLWMRVPVLATVGLGQVIQLPIAVSATVGNALHGSIDLRIAAPLSLLLMIGVWFGARIAHRISSAAMRRSVSLVLLAIGVMMLVRVAMRTIGATGA